MSSGLTSRRLSGSHIRQCCFGIPVVINIIRVIKSTIQKKYTPSSHLLPIVYSFFQDVKLTIYI